MAHEYRYLVLHDIKIYLKSVQEALQTAVMDDASDEDRVSLTHQYSFRQILGSVLTVAGRGIVVGAGLHLGQQLISGVTSGKLTRQ